MLQIPSHDCTDRAANPKITGPFSKRSEYAHEHYQYRGLGMGRDSWVRWPQDCGRRAWCKCLGRMVRLRRTRQNSCVSCCRHDEAERVPRRTTRGTSTAGYRCQGWLQDCSARLRALYRRVDAFNQQTLSAPRLART